MPQNSRRLYGQHPKSSHEKSSLHHLYKTAPLECVYSPKVRLKAKLNHLLWKRKSKHQECNACMFIECYDGNTISSNVKFLMIEQKLIKLHLVWQFNSKAQVRQTIFVSKCATVEYLLSFLKHEFGLPAATLIHKSHSLNLNSFISDYEFCVNDILTLIISEQSGGGGPQWSCTFCDESFSSHDALEAHFAKKHPQSKSGLDENELLGYFKDQSQKDVEYQAQLIRCTLCDIGFKTQHAHNVHFDKMHKSNFICEPCKKEFKSKAAFTRHNNSVHKGLPLLQDKTTNHLSQEAQTNDTGNISCFDAATGMDALRCQPCNREFKTKAGLTRHNKSYHTGQPAETSKKAASWKENSKAVKMTVLKKMDDVLSPTFQCPECLKEFKLQRSLTNHQKTHKISEGERLEKEKQRKKAQRQDPFYRKEEADAKSKKKK